MFCPECGTSNKEGLKFCTKCGSKLEDNQPTLLPVHNSFSIKKLVNKATDTKRKRIVALTSIIVIIALIIASFVFSTLNDPARIAKEYFESIRDNDWESMYSYLAIEESPLLNKDAFVSMMSSQDNSLSVESYKIEDNSLGDMDNSLSKTYMVNYIEKGTSALKTFPVTLVRQEGKHLLFFDNYKVSAGDLIAMNYTITVPKGMAVFIDDVSITNTINDSNKNSTNLTDKFQAPSLLAGTHVLKVTSEITEDYSEEIAVQNGGSISVSNLAIKKSDIDILAKNTETVIQELYNCALGNGALALSVPVTKDIEDVENLNELFDRIVSNVKNSDGTGLRSVSFKEFKPKTTTTKLSDNFTYQSSVEFQYDTVRITKNYSDDTLTDVPSTRTRNGTVSVTYIYEDGQWVIQSINNYSISY